MQKPKILIFIIFISHVCFGNNFQGQNNYTELTYKWINEKIIIPVKINNKDYRFILDTGAVTLVSKELSEVLNISKEKSIEVNDASGKIMTLDQIVIPKIKIGSTSFNNTTALINQDDSNLLFSCFKIDGLIGSNLFKSSILQILPDIKKIKITSNSSRLNLQESKSAKMELSNQGLPYLLVELKGNKKAKGYVLIDTGMKGFFDLSNDNLKTYQKRNIFDIHSTSTGFKGGGLFGIENETEYHRMELPKMIINSTEFKNINIETTHSKSSRIGTEILNYGSLTIDYINKNIYFDSEKKSYDLSKALLGFTPTLVDGKLILGLIWDENLKNKINVGDQIISINGTDFTNYSMCNLITKENIFKTAKSFKIKLKDNDGKIIELVINKNYRQERI